MCLDAVTRHDLFSSTQSMGFVLAFRVKGKDGSDPALQ